MYSTVHLTHLQRQVWDFVNISHQLLPCRCEMPAVCTVWGEKFHKPVEKVMIVSRFGVQGSGIPSPLGCELVKVDRIQLYTIWGSLFGVDLGWC